MKEVSKQTQRMEATHDKPAMTMGLDIEAPDESHTPEQKQRQLDTTSRLIEAPERSLLYEFLLFGSPIPEHQ